MIAAWQTPRLALIIPPLENKQARLLGASAARRHPSAEADRKDVAVCLEAIGHTPTVVVADALDDGEAEAVALRLRRGAVETLEDFGLVEGVARGCVGYRQLPGRYAYEDVAARGVVADGVDHEVAHHAFHERAVGSHHEAVGLGVERYRSAVRHDFELRQQSPCQVHDVHRLVRLVLVVLQLRQEQQVVVQSGQPCHGLPQFLYCLGLPLGDAGLLHEQVEPALEHGEWRLQFVRGVLGEFLLLSVAVEAASHQRHERAVQPRELRSAAIVELWYAAVLQAEALDSLQYPVEWSPQAARHDLHRHHDSDAQDNGSQPEL